MYARRKIRSLEEEENDGLRSRVLDPNAGAHMRAVRLTDLPLIEAALRVDRIVVSLDEEARAAFQFEELSTITWVNPVRERERVSSGLEDGAAAVEEWKLGYET